MSNISGFDQWLQDGKKEENSWVSKSNYGATGEYHPNQPQQNSYHYEQGVNERVESDTTASTYDSVVKKIENLRKIQKKITENNARIGSSRDTKENRDTIIKEISAWKSTYQKAKRELAQLSDTDKRKKRLEKDIKDAQLQFDPLSIDTLRKMEKSQPISSEGKSKRQKRRADTNDPYDEGRQLLQEVDVQFENEVQYNETIIREREVEALQIESKVMDIHSSFVELNRMLQDQDSSIQEYEIKVKKAHTDVKAGVGNVIKAEKHDKRGRLLICLLLLVVLGISLVVVIFFALLFALKFL